MAAIGSVIFTVLFSPSTLPPSFVDTLGLASEDVGELELLLVVHVMSVAVA